MVVFLCLIGAILVSLGLFYLGARVGWEMGIDHCTRELIRVSYAALEKKQREERTKNEGEI